MVPTLPGRAENIQIVMPIKAAPISANSVAGAGRPGDSCARHRTAQDITAGAMHKDPSHFPAHQSCHSLQ